MTVPADAARPARPAPAPPPAVDGAVDASETAAPGAGAPSADTPDTDATGVDQHFLGRLAAAREAYALPPRLRAGTERAVRELLALLFPQLATEEAACGVREVADELAGVRRALRRVLAPVAQVTGRTAEALEAAAVAELPAVYDALLEDARATHDGDPAAASVDEVIAAYPASTPRRATASPTCSTATACRCCRASSPSTRTARRASTSTPAPPSAAPSPSTTAPAWWWARPRCWATACGSTRA
jgi:hypothetical protein